MNKHEKDITYDIEKNKEENGEVEPDNISLASSNSSHDNNDTEKINHDIAILEPVEEDSNSMIIEMESNQREMKFFKRDLRSFYDHDPEEFAFEDVTQRKKTKKNKNELPKGLKVLFFFQ